MTSIHARTVMLGDAHWEVQVFAGPDETHRALTGRLIATPAEAKALVERLNGPDPAELAQYSYRQGYDQAELEYEGMAIGMPVPFTKDW